MISQNTTNFEDLGETENIDIDDDEVEGEEASPKVPSFCKSKKVRRSDSRVNNSKLSMAIEPIANAII